jgi:DNA polymerase I-like protein with 3'-5' exonuclease and polymerase domains
VPTAQVHDELILEVRQDRFAQAAALVRDVMEGAASIWHLKCALPVKLHKGPDWGHLQEEPWA